MSAISNELSVASEKVLLELARFLLQNGVSHKEFAILSRKAFITAGTEILERKNQFTINRLLEITGLTRNEITRTDSKLAEGVSEFETTLSNATRALHKWYTNPEFVNKEGQPRELDLTDADIFEQLFGIGIGQGGDKLLAELVDAGSIERTTDELWRPTTRYYIPKKRHLRFVYFGQSVSRLISTLNRNINNPNVDAWLERAVCSVELKPGSGPLFTRVGKEQALRLLDSLDDWMSSNEYQSNEVDAESDTVGIGLYYFEEKY